VVVLSVVVGDVAVREVDELVDCEVDKTVERESMAQLSLSSNESTPDEMSFNKSHVRHVLLNIM
jgi:hypothetical protein